MLWKVEQHPTEGEVEFYRPIVVLEGYVDHTDGRIGGEWKKMIELTDDGKWG